MKNILLFLLLMVLVVPVTAQSKQPLIKAGQYANPELNSSSRQSDKTEKGMNSKDYEEVLRVISKEVFDEKRLNVAKRVISVNSMTTKQIVNIGKLFTFETNLLEFAKFAYPHCVDPGKYYLLDELFIFESSKQELHDLIISKNP